MTDSLNEIWIDPVFRPSGRYDLVRLGRDYDGGYLVDRRSVTGASHLLSFGINDDWSFEQDFRRLNPVEVDMYDHTVHWKGFVNDAYLHFFRLDRFGDFLRRVRVVKSYHDFVRGPVRHHRIAIGYDRPGGTSLATLLADMPGAPVENLFLKIDIEGWEFRILDQIVEAAEQFEGLAIEFHQVDLHLDRVTDFISRLPLSLCHIHANNYDRPTPSGLPLTIELSFSRYPPLAGDLDNLPHKLDMPNNPATPEFALRFGYKPDRAAP